jgi:hypothetical protein
LVAVAGEQAEGDSMAVVQCLGIEFEEELCWGVVSSQEWSEVIREVVVGDGLVCQV